MLAVSPSTNQQHVIDIEDRPLLDSPSPSLSELPVEGVRNTSSRLCGKLISFSRVTSGTALAGMLTGAAAWAGAVQYGSDNHDFSQASDGALFTLGGIAIGACAGAAGWAVREAIRNCVNSESEREPFLVVDRNDPHQTISSVNDTYSNHSDAVSPGHNGIANPSESPTPVRAVLPPIPEDAMLLGTSCSDAHHDAKQTVSLAIEKLRQEMCSNPDRLDLNALAVPMEASLTILNQYLSDGDVPNADTLLASIEEMHRNAIAKNSDYPHTREAMKQAFNEVSAYLDGDTYPTVVNSAALPESATTNPVLSGALTGLLATSHHAATQALEQALIELDREKSPKPRNGNQNGFALKMRDKLTPLYNFMNAGDLSNARTCLDSVKRHCRITSSACHPNDLSVINRSFAKITAYLAATPH